MSTRDRLNAYVARQSDADRAEFSALLDDLCGENLYDAASKLLKAIPGLYADDDSLVVAHWSQAAAFLHQLVPDGVARRLAGDTERAGSDRPVSPEDATDLPAPFFVSGHTYRRDWWRFACHAVAPAPHSGEVRAIGFLFGGDGTETAHAMNADDWGHGGWVDIAREEGSE